MRPQLLIQFGQSVERYQTEFVSLQKLEQECLQAAKKFQKHCADHFHALAFVHGTFVGDDPFNLTDLLHDHLITSGGKTESAASAKKQRWRFLHYFSKKTADIFCGDFGNFTDQHEAFVKEHLGYNKSVCNVTWSSGNNHYSRVHGAIQLLATLKSQGFFQPHLPWSPRHYCLIGHSHAGQLFSLLTLFCTQVSLRHFVASHFFSNLSERRLFFRALADFHRSHVTFITLGTPPRYQWHLQGLCNRQKQLFHFINHRKPRSKSHATAGGGFAGALTTKSGDYIQQWGVHGSDIAPVSKKARLLNEQLGMWLGVGHDRSQWQIALQSKMRLHHQGHHFLCDYGDNALYPNFMQSGLGHGIYTRLKYIPWYFVKVKETSQYVSS